MTTWKGRLGWLLILGLLYAAPPLATFSQGPEPTEGATLRVKLPPDATLTIDTVPTRQVGANRLFVTPPLAPGKTFTYQLEATWREAGEEKKLSLIAIVRAGQQTVLDFTAAATAVAAKESPPTEPKKEAEPKKDLKKEPKKEPKKDPTTEPKKEPKSEPKDPASTGKQRTFLLTYAGTIKDLKPDQEALVWLPMAVSSSLQDVTIASKNLPAPEKIGTDKEYGNKMIHFQARADKDGLVPFKVVYKVTRREVKTDAIANVTLKPKEKRDLLSRFLEPDALVPISGKPLDLIKDKKLPGDQFASAKIMYDMVNGHMKYSKEGTGWGKGDSVWACDSKFGNCTDFHSLFISMARGNKIPAKFEMGFPLPTKRGAGPVLGYHCWAWFLPDGKGWVPVDISEANRNPELREYYFGNLTEDRVAFSKGRDIILEPPQSGPALNFFIYPYVEVNGQPYPADKVQRSFAFEDVPGK